MASSFIFELSYSQSSLESHRQYRRSTRSVCSERRCQVEVFLKFVAVWLYCFQSCLFGSLFVLNCLHNAQITAVVVMKVMMMTTMMMLMMMMMMMTMMLMLQLLLLMEALIVREKIQLYHIYYNGCFNFSYDSHSSSAPESFSSSFSSFCYSY